MTDEATGQRSREQQLEWEARFGPLAGAAAAGAFVLQMLPGVYLSYAFGGAPRGPAQALELTAANRADVVIAASLQALCLLLLGGALAFLVLASRHRRPATPAGALPVVMIGAAAAAAAAVVQAVGALDTATAFVAEGARTPARAQELLRTGGQSTTVQVALGANIALGLAILLAAVSAMRAGLLSRFIGALGIVVGVLTGFPLFGQPVFLLLFWSGALALLLLDRWPGGRGPAWSTGEATPWPTAVERRAELDRRRAAAAGEGGETDGAEPPARAKRKRKRGGR